MPYSLCECHVAASEDIVLIPLQFFDLPESEFLDFLSWSTIAFWSIDIVCTSFN